MMPNYRRNFVKGGTWFFTVVTYNRCPWLCDDDSRKVLREGIEKVRQKHPFTIDAWVLLPEHLHCIWTLPEGDADFSVRWRLIKTYVTKHLGNARCDTPAANTPYIVKSASRERRKEQYRWQRRFWEHTIRDQEDYNRHCDYIHFNPVKHELCAHPKDWEYSTFHRFVENDWYSFDWAEEPELDEDAIEWE